MISLRPYQKQIVSDGIRILEQYKILYLAGEVRTGKTLIALSIFNYCAFPRVLFLTKKKAIASIQSDYNNLSPEYHLTVTNYEQIDKLKSKDFDAVIIDEAHSFSAFPKPSKRTLAARKICEGKPVVFLSGTPSPESYSQIYHQLSLSSFSPLSAYTNFYKFAKVFVDVKQKKISASQTINDYSHCNGDLLWKYIKHLFIRFSQEEAGFTAPVDEIILDVEISNEARKIYKELENHKIHTRYNQHTGSMINATVNSGADMINKLSQISSGTLIFDEDQKGVIIDWSKATFIVSYFANKKIAIFYRYRAEFDLLKSFFPNWTDSPELFNSSASLTFLGQIQSAREGVNLSTADALVMYNIDFSATSYFQARARIQSKERKGSAPLYWIFSIGGIERKIYQAVTNKKNFTYSYYRSHAGKTDTGQSKKAIGEGRLVGTEAGSGF